ncbi:hypothetical protein [Escherichia phage CLB_P2]|uniref:Uncharacterized protein a-gt.5 n=4 Tax=Dhakavirus TaxID=1914165 RepID=C4MZF6_9CAUD|nr:a-gt.5 hypothetical protein [Escherichia phage JS98]YP_002922410.1 a-gt.5 hypothetical protein [Escherichia phage JS10]YP_010094359.1 hypothetical protein KNT84_gp216 [Enterobacteria phage vB_EcoM_IME281]QAY00091.1 hypothetical protein EcWhh1_160 [Escherichia phage EcWhh-1]QHR70741.1 hypothetical protein dhaeg_197 [Escherichia phage dhaeg]QHR72468.1 hypothetical protein dhabil_125 [Escherichia phage dhabil]QIN95912.1 hypothetical protein MN04_00123 [Escherichia phage MN04]UNI73113.1 hypot
MELKINLVGLLEEVDGEYSAIPYVLKMYLKDIAKLPIVIDPKHPDSVEIKAEKGTLTYNYHVTDEDFYIKLNYKD